MEPIKRLVERVERAGEGSDTASFFGLLYLGEFLCKLTIVGLLAILDEDDDRNRYRLEYTLARADSLGEWISAFDEILAGPPSQNILTGFRDTHRELTQRVPLGASWQAEAVRLMHGVCLLLDPEYPELPTRVAARRMFQDFLWLRNKTRGHGAPTERFCSHSVPLLRKALDLYRTHFSLFAHSWAYLHRNLSGKYRVMCISGSCSELQHLKTTDAFNYPNGVYLAHTEPLGVPLFITDVDLSDFWAANGNFRDTSYEALSYISDDRRRVDASDYLLPPAALPESETQGLGTLELIEASFTNVPSVPATYVERQELEKELLGTLYNDRHPVVTLTGAGGIGKTSLALRVLHDIAASGRFYAILWFSARDIDLIPSGPKQVRPDVLTPEAIASTFCHLTLSETEGPLDKREELARFTQALASPNDSPYLFVFDNFETVRNPSELYRWLDNYIRLPNKVLITTRLRDFKGDYPVHVGGMTVEEFRRLAYQTAEALSVSGLLTDRYLQNLYEETGGHPYVVKILIGELQLGRRTTTSIQRIMASKEDILEALFERTYDFLPPAAQRVFLTLSAWRSLVPRVGLEAVLLYSAKERFDVEHSIDLLAKSSLIEVLESPGDEAEFLSVPLTAALFGKKKLLVSPWRSAIEADLALLQLFGASQESDVKSGLGPKIRRFYSSVARSTRKLDELVPLLELLARRYPPGWLTLADLYEERSGSRSSDAVIRAVQQYLEVVPSDGRAWDRLAKGHGRRKDYVGEVNALVQKCALASTPFVEISSAANRLNALLHDGRLQVDSEEKRILAEDLLRALEVRSAEGRATDHSRIAWLCLHLQQEQKAKEYVRRGLELDSNNVHCNRLAKRLNVLIAAEE
jgi:hypothetical protein